MAIDESIEVKDIQISQSKLHSDMVEWKVTEIIPNYGTIPMHWDSGPKYKSEKVLSNVFLEWVDGTTTLRKKHVTRKHRDGLIALLYLKSDLNRKDIAGLIGVSVDHIRNLTIDENFLENNLPLVKYEDNFVAWSVEKPANGYLIFSKMWK